MQADQAIRNDVGDLWLSQTPYHYHAGYRRLHQIIQLEKGHCQRGCNII